MTKKKTPLIGILTQEVREEGDSIVITGSCVCKLLGSTERMDTEQLRIEVMGRDDIILLSFDSRYGKKLPVGISINNYRIEVSWKEARNLDIQNRLLVVYKGKHQGRVLYNVFDLKKGHNKNSEIFVHDGTAMYFRQNLCNTMWLTVRDANQYDYPEGQERISRAYECAKKMGENDIVLMYEKNCSRYEESASVLYEKLIDSGYDNVYYVVNFDNPMIQNLDEKYRKNLIEKDSDKHLEYFFASNKFISSESTDHAMQLRIANKLVQDKLQSSNLQYVFLQHGVMYMVSLNSDLRVGFRRKSGHALHKTVVSSQLEADHFIELAGMSQEDLYVTGLAKFDKCYRDDDADKIIIMLTWRRWETNQARDDLENTKYYQMIKRIYEAIPDELKDKVVILPHPLMADRFKELGSLGEKILLADSYDLVLRKCSVLITDYSSIAYDAFYRGANVVFCWEEKEECMGHYGEGSHLMLNAENCFGPICMNKDEIAEAVKATYGEPQTDGDIERYRRIVEFHDGRNSERIMEHLIKDGVIGG